ncbi:hypothetical protein KIW84_042671 [Lathyrus oleraceus]|uniref:Uncharacterized protein n=1 Tax=Pisum sativum TaxID=3888 RepID=A0A9D4XF39_PEA|nr:hypothetical protein KIW84_042671 [Pisum sativum]
MLDSAEEEYSLGFPFLDSELGGKGVTKFLLGNYVTFTWGETSRWSMLTVLFNLKEYLTQEILRQSIHPPNTESSKIMNTATSTTAFAVAKPSHHSKRFLEGDAEAFRPTNPGHSPGVGHSINT